MPSPFLRSRIAIKGWALPSKAGYFFDMLRQNDLIAAMDLAPPRSAPKAGAPPFVSKVGIAARATGADSGAGLSLSACLLSLSVCALVEAVVNGSRPAADSDAGRGWGSGAAPFDAMAAFVSASPVFPDKAAALAIAGGEGVGG